LSTVDLDKPTSDFLNSYGTLFIRRIDPIERKIPKERRVLFEIDF
jgi:hypothetical protein